MNNVRTTHSTDAVLKTAKKSGGTPQFSKNAPMYISIGGGLSVMAGLPRIPTWNTLGRPANPKKGTIGVNTETKRLEAWDGFIWRSATLKKNNA